MMKAITAKRRLIALMRMMLAMAAMAANTTALEIEYIGTITEGFHSPTSVAASEDMVAVLDPYAKNLTLFSPDGPVTRKIDLAGNAHSLIRLDENTFAFCDRSRKTVMAVEIDLNRQYEYAGAGVGLLDPLDIDFDGTRVHILDAGNSAVYIFDQDRVLSAIVGLTDEVGQAIRYASSFAYDPVREIYFVMDQTRSRIYRFAGDGRYLGSLGSFGPRPGQISRGGEIEITDDGRVLVTDRYQGHVSVFDGDGPFLGIFGTGGSGESSLSIPTGISIDENQLVYVVSTMGASIAVFHLPRASDETDLLTVWQQYPEDGAELPGKAVTLEVFIEAYQAAGRVTGFDFQIFDGDVVDSPVAESALLPPDSYVGLPDERQRVGARWAPKVTFGENTRYSWRSRVHTADTSGEWTAMRSFTVVAIPGIYRLDQNVPNPFNPETSISFSTAGEGKVYLQVINILGQQIRVLVDDRLPPGEHRVTWDGLDDAGRRAASGIYFYRLRAGSFTQSRKMILLR